MQTHQDWIWVLCANKFSDRMAKFARSKQKLDGKDRIVYLTTNLKENKNPFSLLANIGKRRDICIKRMNVDYFFMINADSKIIDKEMLHKIYVNLEKNPKDLCIYKIIHEKGEVFPRFPFAYQGIDSLNFCVSARIAKKVGYPSNADFSKLNDWRFFARVFEECGGDYSFINEVFCIYNGNNRYRNVITILWRKSLRFTLLDYIAYCLQENYIPGLMIFVKELLINAGFPRKALFKEKTYS